MPALDELLDYVFDGKKPALYPELATWARDSRRFRAFATVNRDKIRAKLRNVHDEGELNDFRAELEAAMLLLRDDRFTLEYERYAVAKRRGPDYTVTFRTHTPFNVEVRRIRTAEPEDRTAEARVGKLVTVLCEKARQMPPSTVNLLWLSAEREIVEGDLISAAITLRQLAESKAEAFFARRGFESAADFLKQYRQLSGIVLRQSGRATAWLNPLARHRVPSEIVTAIKRLAAV